MIKNLTCILFVCIPLVGFSQVASREHDMRVGFKVDVQSAGIANQNNYGQNEMDYGAHLGLGIGASLTYALNPKYSLVLEFSYQTSGQEYEDHFKGRTFRKEVEFNLISFPVMFRHRITEAVGYSGVGVVKPQWYVQGGIQVDRILSPGIRWYLDGTETTMFPFVLEGGNPNEAELLSLGEPQSDAELFNEWSMGINGASGFQLNFTPYLSLTAEVRGGIGISDLNPKKWRLPNNDGIYGASRTTFLGLHIGIQVRFAQN
jgi:hypothetical protein